MFSDNPMILAGWLLLALVSIGIILSTALESFKQGHKLLTVFLVVLAISVTALAVVAAVTY